METVEVVETAGVGKDGKKSEDKYPKNIVQVPYIWYPITFRKKSVPVSTLFGSDSKVNAIHPIFTKELGFVIKLIDIRVQKIVGITLDTFEIVVAAFSVTDKANWVRFFEETFLVVNVSLEVVFRISFPILSSANVDFLVWEFWWRNYTIEEALSTTRGVKLVGKKEFAATVLDLESEFFVLYIVSLRFDMSPSSFLLKLNNNPSYRFQAFGLIAEKASTKVSAKYLDFSDVFSPDLAFKLLKHIRINDHAIELVDGHQLLYGLIFSLGLIELEALKTYIKINLANGFIRLSKSPIGALNLFDRKSDSYIWLYINYWGLNNLTIKKQYLLPLIGKLLDRLKRAKQYTQLDLTSAYYQIKICKGDK